MASAAWTAEQDAAIIAGRERGMSWVALGLEMHKQPHAIRCHAVNDLGLPVALPPDAPKLAWSTERREKARAYKARVRLGKPVVTRRNDAPMRAGHPVSWGAISSNEWQRMGVAA